MYIKNKFMIFLKTNQKKKKDLMLNLPSASTSKQLISLWNFTPVDFMNNEFKYFEMCILEKSTHT